MQRMTLIVTSVIGLLVATNTNADNNIVWTDPWPKTGQQKGTIAVKGTITLDPGWHVNTSIGIEIWPADGGVQQFHNISVHDWYSGTDIGDLTSGKNYNVTARVTVVKMGTYQTLVLVTKQARAK
jgi:hypothetical protein